MVTPNQDFMKELNMTNQEVTDSTVTIKIDEHIATITINRPHAMNALDPDTLQQLAKIWLEVRDNDDIWVAIVTGEGEQSFCAGSDLKKTIPQGNQSDPFQSQGLLQIDNGLELWKPVIAAVRGYCLGAGMTLLSACDIRVASDDSMFGLPEVQRGIVPTLGATQRIPKQLPWAIAMEVLLLGDKLTAQQALHYGLINRVVKSKDVITEAENIARRLTSEVAPLTSLEIKEAAVRSQSVGLTEGLRIEALLSRHVRNTDDAKEGPKAFAEKRAPVYKGQ
jgi:enoyl-CoA hydratase/carnithine racemase